MSGSGTTTENDKKKRAIGAINHPPTLTAKWVLSILTIKLDNIRDLALPQSPEQQNATANVCKYLQSKRESLSGESVPHIIRKLRRHFQSNRGLLYDIRNMLSAMAIILIADSYSCAGTMPHRVSVRAALRQSSAGALLVRAPRFNSISAHRRDMATIPHGCMYVQVYLLCLNHWR